LTDKTYVGPYSEYDNVIDYTQIKMLKLADRYADSGRLDIAEKLWAALDMYMERKIKIWFDKGEPVMRKYTEKELEEFSKQSHNKDDETSP